MSKFEKQYKEEQERKEREKVRKEKLAGFLYNMALATFSVWVLGIALSIRQSSEITSESVYMIVGGLIAVLCLAIGGNNRLKK